MCPGFVSSAEISIYLQDSVSVESALYNEPGVLEAAAVGVPDRRLGELVAAFVKLKPGYAGKVSEKSLLSLAKKLYVLYA